MADNLAIEGGTPVRTTLLPYGKQNVSEEDQDAVREVLLSDWLTTGPMVAAFEARFARETDAVEAVVLGSGTAALHAAMHAIGVGPGDEVLVPALTFRIDNATNYAHHSGFAAQADRGAVAE